MGTASKRCLRSAPLFLCHTFHLNRGFGVRVTFVITILINDGTDGFL